MGLGIINDEEFNKELAGSKEPVGHASKRAAAKVRGEAVAVGTSVRKMIAEEALEGGNITNAANTFGVDRAAATRYLEGKPGSNLSKVDEDLKSHVDNVRNRIITKATDSLETILGSINDEEVKTAKLRDKTGAARDLAGVVRDMQPVNDNDGNKMNVQFVLHAPAVRDIKEFEVIDLGE